MQNVHLIGRLMPFGKVGRHASEEVGLILQLVKSKCMPMLLHELECFGLLTFDVKSLDFALSRFLMKLLGHLTLTL